MEDGKSLQASSPPLTTGPQISLDSGVTSNLVGKEAGKECVPLESSRPLPVVAPVPSIVEPPFSEAGAGRHEPDGVAAVAGATLAATDEQDLPGGAKALVTESAANDEDPLGAGKALVAESPVLDEPVVQVLSNARTGGQCAATGSSDQPQEEKPESVESLNRTYEVKERSGTCRSHDTDSLKHGELNGVDSINGEQLRSKPQVDRDTLTSPSESTLMDVLGKLVSLDPTEIFSDPVNDSFAPNYSKVIKTPMCFSVMQEKIGLQQYPSWSLFVEDFERICYNAMKYNQKRSRIWNAASTLLRQGKKVIEPYTEKVESMLDLSGAVEDAPASAAQDAAKTAPPDSTKSEGQDIVEDAVQAPAKAVILDVKEKVIQMATGTPDELGENKAVASHQGGVHEKECVPKPGSAIAEVALAAISPTPLDMQSSQDGGNGDPGMPGDISQDARKEMVTVARDGGRSLAIQNDELPHNSKTPNAGTSFKTRANHVDEDTKVEILESSGSEDVRPDSRDEATENSSSFADTQSKGESDPEGGGFQQNAEVESELRDGNGAFSSACADDDEVAGGNERGKKALNADWKKYRRGIEWRCRWLEIRLNELRERSQRYDRQLEERRAKKAKTWVPHVQPGEESSARSAQMVGSPERGRILRRLRRKQDENTVNLDLYMARHPLFSRYGTYGESKYKKRKRENEDPYVEAKVDAFQHTQNRQNLVEQEQRAPDESDTEEQLALGRSSLGSQDSMEKILWKVEALQARVEKAKIQLLRGAPPKNVPQPLTIPKPPSNFSRAASQASPSPRMMAPGGLPRPPGTKGRPPSGHSPGFSGTPTTNGAPQRQASVQFRRKSADYDINNMVMPVSVGAKYVEHIKHADIWTPHWRLIEDTEAAEQSTVGSSSDEDTDDEKFENRHSEMEVNEKKLRYTLPPKRSPDGDAVLAGKGRSKSGMGKGAGKMSGRDSVPTKAVAGPAVESPPESGSAPAYAGSVPKGKRRKRLFNATAFTTNRAQRLTAHVAEPSSSLPSPEGAKESVREDTVETRTSVETHTEHTIALPELEKSSEQPVQSADQADAKRKRSAASGLQVLANP